MDIELVVVPLHQSGGLDNNISGQISGNNHREGDQVSRGHMGNFVGTTVTVSVNQVFSLNREDSNEQDDERDHLVSCEIEEDGRWSFEGKEPKAVRGVTLWNPMIRSQLVQVKLAYWTLIKVKTKESQASIFIFAPEAIIAVKVEREG